MPTIFISYRREDSAGYAGRLCESLERRLGRQQVFRDVDAIGPGQDFVDAIDARLRECRALLVLIGREWLDAADVSGSTCTDRLPRAVGMRAALSGVLLADPAFIAKQSCLSFVRT